LQLQIELPVLDSNLLKGESSAFNSTFVFRISALKNNNTLGEIETYDKIKLISD